MEFLWRVYRTIYGELLKDLGNDGIKFKYSYPKTVSGAYSLLTDYTQYKPYT